MTHETRLSPLVLADLVERFGDRPDPTGRAQARFPLRHCTAVAQVQREAGDCEEVAIEVVDLAVSGLGLKTRVPLVAGSLLTIELRAPAVRPQVWRCRVVHVYAFDGTYYHAGARFETTNGT